MRPFFRICGVPSERRDVVAWHSQGFTLGWYALPLRGKRRPSGDNEGRLSGVHICSDYIIVEHSQGFTLGWYALPLRCKGVLRR
jgi:hypothetical protein